MLHYEFIFIINLDNLSVFVPNYSSGLAKRIFHSNDEEIELENFLDNLLQKKDKFKNLLNIIKQTITNTNSNDNASTIFVANLKMNFGTPAMEHSATFKFLPIYKNDKKFLVTSISIPHCNLSHNFYLIDTVNGNIKQYNFNNQTWVNLKFPRLSEIEISVLGLSSKGLSIDEISLRINISKDGVKSIRKRIFNKLNVTNISEAISTAIIFRII